MLSLRKALAIALVSAAAAFAPETASAQGVPQTLLHQGRLFDSTGGPLSGRQTVTYRIYDAATGGMVLWTETNSVTLDEGFFSVQLGATTPFPSTVFNGSSRYLAVQVGSDPEMTPREVLTSVPYALVAGDAVGDLTPRSISVGGPIVNDSQAR